MIDEVMKAEDFEIMDGLFRVQSQSVKKIYGIGR